MESLSNRIGFIYSIDLGNKVKVGCSKKPKERIYELSKTLGLDSPRHYISKKCLDHYKVESKVHSLLGGKNGFGEFFEVGFDESVKVIDSEVMEISDQEEKTILEKEDVFSKFQSNTMAQIIPKDFPSEGVDEKYKAIISDAMSWCDNFGIDRIDDLMACNGDIVEALSVSLLIHKEVIDKIFER